MTKLMIIAALLSGCSVRFADVTLLSSKTTAKFQTTGPRVTGKSCAPVALFQLGAISIKDAIDSAIHQSAGADALQDAVVYFDDHVFFVGTRCFRAEGAPISTVRK